MMSSIDNIGYEPIVSPRAVAANFYRRPVIAWAAILLVFHAGTTLGAENTGKPSTAVDFTLEDFRGKQHALSDYADRPVVVLAFLGVECPLAKLYAPRLQQLAREFERQGVQFLGIDANQQDSMTELAAYARVHELTFPLLKDAGNVLADRVNAERTPEVVVLDRDRRIRYRGRIDDQYGIGYVRDQPEQQPLRRAVEELLAGKDVTLDAVEPVGCLIGRIREPRPDSKVTYAEHVAAVLHKHCVECHREGDIAPFTLTGYDDVVGWGPMIAEVIAEQRMPPWHANPQHGRFQNERLMSDAEKQLVFDWVRAGCPPGDLSQVPELPVFQSGWQLPQEPDLVIKMRDEPFVVPAEGTVEYQYFVVDPQFEEDKWVAAAEIIPGNRGVVHHAIAFVRPPDSADFKGIGWLASYVPGQRIEQLEPTVARRVPAGSKLVFQMHYTPTGSPQPDLSRLGIVFADPDVVREEVVTMIAMNQSFEIPPHAAEHPVEATLEKFPADGRLLAVVPHMHLRGSAFRVEAVTSEGEPEILLDVPHYDFNWQTTYLLAEPRAFPTKTQLRCTAVFDNSQANLNNPDPSQTVRWGDQTWEEMALGYFAVALPVDGEIAESEPHEEDSEELKAAALAKAKALMKDLDQDGDGRALRSEVTEAYARFAFRKIDTNDDDVVTLEELAAEVRRSMRKDRRNARRRP